MTEAGLWAGPLSLDIRRGAGEGTRTLDPLLGKQMLYQLSYSRSVGLTGQRRTTAAVRSPFNQPALGSSTWPRIGGCRCPGLTTDIGELRDPDLDRGGSPVQGPEPERA